MFRLEWAQVDRQGSKNGGLTNSEALFKAPKRNDEPRLAIISASGTKPGLPHREVLKDYLDESWRILTTTKRVGRVAPNSPIALANRKKQPQYDTESNDIQISWSSAEGMKWKPAGAEIDRSDLSLY